MLQYLHTLKSKAQDRILFIPSANLGNCLGNFQETAKNYCFNPNLGELYRGLFKGWWWWWEVKLHWLKLARFMLETSNLAHK